MADHTASVLLLLWLPTGAPLPVTPSFLERQGRTLLAASTESVAVSQDAGETWRRIPFLAIEGPGPRVTGLAVCRTNVLVATNRGLWLGSTAAGALRPVSRIGPVAISALCRHGHRVVAGGYNRLWSSSDCGRTWRQGPAPGRTIRCALGPSRRLVLATSAGIFAYRGDTRRALLARPAVRALRLVSGGRYLALAGAGGFELLASSSGRTVVHLPFLEAEDMLEDGEGALWLAGRGVWRMQSGRAIRADLGLASGRVRLAPGPVAAVGRTLFRLVSIQVSGSLRLTESTLCGPRPLPNGLGPMASPRKSVYLLPKLEAILSWDSGLSRDRRGNLVQKAGRGLSALVRLSWPLGQRILPPSHDRALRYRAEWTARRLRAWRTCQLMAWAARHTRRVRLAAELATAASSWAALAHIEVQPTTGR